MKKKKLLLALALILLMLTNTGCIGVNKNFKFLRNQVFENLDSNFDKTIEFSIGKSAFLFLSNFIDVDDEESENIKNMLKDVSHISIGIYERDNKNEIANSKFPQKLLSRISQNLEVEDWESIVKVNSNDETIGIYVKENDSEEINEMFAVILSDNEMVMLDLNGNLNSLTEQVIEQQGFGTKITNRH
jgi:hypothetical protein